MNEKAEADLARRDAEKVAGTAKVDSEIARKELEEARNDANAAKEQIVELMKGSGRPASYVKEIIVVNILLMIGVVVFLTWIFTKMRTISTAAKEAENLDIDYELQNSDAERAAVAPPIAGSTEAETPIDRDEVVRQLAETLGVQDSILLSPAGLADMDFDPPADTSTLFMASCADDHKISKIGRTGSH
jgi:hypothetical protein